ncbi:hypothetical protein FNJ84_05715 [Paracoccus sp. M683]|uniref:hypothetical protein n=1 Tax=Paracoccus sp. M683 TaxID=2594268 RepID=UPI00117E8C2C|nr:hypothetical protein [Paracoccus sp. M683]TRW98275.1 hypothetical protein FNJ84_05715 [Paracoccus sp. M683]
MRGLAIFFPFCAIDSGVQILGKLAQQDAKKAVRLVEVVCGVDPGRAIIATSEGMHPALAFLKPDLCITCRTYTADPLPVCGF